MPGAVIFDMDGVLIDSRRPHFISWQASCQARGYRLDEATFDQLFGQPFVAWVAALAPEGLPETAIQEWYDDKEAHYRDLVRDDPPLMPGADALIAELAAAGWHCGIGSAGPRANVELVRAALPHGAAIGTACSADDVARPKPAPDVFLLAAERLGLPPDRCIVIEDSLHGLAAAAAAGMARVALTSTLPAVALRPHADRVIDGLAELSADQLAQLLAQPLP